MDHVYDGCDENTGDRSVLVARFPEAHHSSQHTDEQEQARRWRFIKTGKNAGWTELSSNNIPSQ